MLAPPVYGDDKGKNGIVIPASSLVFPARSSPHYAPHCMGPSDEAAFPTTLTALAIPFGFLAFGLLAFGLLAFGFLAFGFLAASYACFILARHNFLCFAERAARTRSLP